MKCMIEFMRRTCERRRPGGIELVDKVNGLGAMVDTVAPKLLFVRNCCNEIVD